jgi:hypothetical protein
MLIAELASGGRSRGGIRGARHPRRGVFLEIREAEPDTPELTRFTVISRPTTFADLFSTYDDGTQNLTVSLSLFFGPSLTI